MSLQQTDRPKPKKLKKKRREDGVTMMELIIVLAILALIATIAVPRLIDMFSRASTDVAKLQLDALSTSLDLYRLDNRRYPTTEEGLDALITRPDSAVMWNGPYVQKKDSLSDPWGRAYQYRFPGEHGLTYDLFTLGADGVEGGDGENADIGNWN